MERKKLPVWLKRCELPLHGPPPKCGGCDSAMSYDVGRRRWAKFHRGHNQRIKNIVVGEYKLHGPPPKCEGCGESVPYDTTRNIWRKFHRGHNLMINNPMFNEVSCRKSAQARLGQLLGDKNPAKRIEVREKIKLNHARPFLGKRQTVESNQKRSLALTGKPKKDTSKMGRYTRTSTIAAKQSKSLKECGRVYVRGIGHFNFGKPAHKGSGKGKGSYCLKGHWVRSSWEREVADWFFQRNVQYEYESKLFDLGNGLRYRPDFYLPEFNVYYEVKGYWTEKCKEQFERFRSQGHTLHVIDHGWWKLYKKVA